MHYNNHLIHFRDYVFVHLLGKHFEIESFVNNGVVINAKILDDIVSFIKNTSQKIYIVLVPLIDFVVILYYIFVCQKIY